MSAYVHNTLFHIPHSFCANSFLSVLFLMLNQSDAVKEMHKPGVCKAFRGEKKVSYRGETV